jgi:hypothetical protein
MRFRSFGLTLIAMGRRAMPLSWTKTVRNAIVL